MQIHIKTVEELVAARQALAAAYGLLFSFSPDNGEPSITVSAQPNDDVSWETAKSYIDGGWTGNVADCCEESYDLVDLAMKQRTAPADVEDDYYSFRPLSEILAKRG